MADYGDSWDGQSVTTNWQTAKAEKRQPRNRPSSAGKQGAPINGPMQPLDPPTGGSAGKQGSANG